MATRRVFRLALTVALSLALAYALRLPLPYLAPVFALLLSATPGPPMGAKSLFGLLVMLSVIMAAGLLLISVLLNFPVTGLLLVAVGLFLAQDLMVNKGKGLVGMFLVIALTLVTAAGVASFSLALTVVKTLVVGIVVAIVCQHIAHWFYPEDDLPIPVAAAGTASRQSRWIALRATIIVFPAYMMALINPGLYLPIIMKSVSLAQQGTALKASDAGTELLGSTLLAGCFAILFWLALQLMPTLWMFFLWTLFFGVYFSSKLYGVVATRYPASYWINVFITLLILLGPAVQDTAAGKDVYKAFAVRLSLYIAVALYAWTAIYILETLRDWREKAARPQAYQRR